MPKPVPYNRVQIMERREDVLVLLILSASSRATRQALKSAGINRSYIMDQNDSGYTFDEIAEYVDKVGGQPNIVES